MSDQEFTDEIRRGLITIMRAVIRKYALSWMYFLPREEQYSITSNANTTTTVPIAQR